MKADERKNRYVQTWEREGAEAVRLKLHTISSWYGDTKEWAIEWVAQKDQERRSLNDASMAEQMRLARSANAIAKQARNAAIAALVVTIVAAIIGWCIR